MSDRERGERRYLPEFPYRQPPIIVEGIENLVEWLSRSSDRSILDLNIITQSLRASSRRILEDALWRVVECTSRQGVLPQIIEVDKFGNPIERSEN